MNKREIQKEQTRLKIIETAQSCYAEDGFLVATAVIAKKANVSHGTIFAHFPKSDDLISAVIQNFYEIIMEKLRLLSSNNSIQFFLQEHLNILSKHELFYKRLIEEKTLIPEEAQLLFIEMQSTISHNFSKIIKKEKSSLKDLPLHFLFNSWISIIHYYLQNSMLFSPDGDVLKQYGDELVSLYIALIKK